MLQLKLCELFSSQDNKQLSLQVWVRGYFILRQWETLHKAQRKLDWEKCVWNKGLPGASGGQYCSLGKRNFRQYFVYYCFLDKVGILILLPKLQTDFCSCLQHPLKIHLLLWSLESGKICRRKAQDMFGTPGIGWRYTEMSVEIFAGLLQLAHRGLSLLRGIKTQINA